MLKRSILTLSIVSTLSLVGGQVFGKNITIFDGETSNSQTYYQGTGVAREDQEVEPPSSINGGVQQWDLEAMLLNGSKLTMVGGYNFINGVSNLKPGDQIGRAHV